MLNIREAGDSVLLDLESETGRSQVAVAATSAEIFSVLDHAHETLLHPNEVTYYRSLGFQKRKKDFLIGRFAAKRALGHFLAGCDYSRIDISPGVFQQPIVWSPFCDRVSVSISHSNGIALALAHSDGHPMGIDAEAIIPSRIDVLASEMTEREKELLDADRAERLDCYTHAWTAKEALSKALRCGLACRFEILEISSLKKAGPAREGRFTNFVQYKFFCWEIDRFSISIVVPSTTAIETSLVRLRELFSAVTNRPIYE